MGIEIYHILAVMKKLLRRYGQLLRQIFHRIVIIRGCFGRSLLRILSGLLHRIKDLFGSFGCRLCRPGVYLLCIQQMCLSSVDGGKFILHGNGMEALLVTFLLERLGFFQAAVVPLQIVAEQQEGLPLVLAVIHGILGHSQVAGAVAEGENRHLADLLHDGGNLVHAEVLCHQLTAHNDVIVGLIGVLLGIGFPLSRGHDGVVGSDHP